MSISWGSKDPDEVRSYSYSWLGRLNGGEIATATLEVKCGTATLSNVANTTTGISATVSGGKACEQVELISRIVTAGGETLEETILLSIEPSAWSNPGPSTSTKRQIVEMAYEECSLAGYEFNVTPQELFSGLRKLDALMAQWRQSSKDLNYNFPAKFGDGDLEDYSGIPDAAVNGAAISLAMAIAPAMGKQMSAESRGRLSKAMTVISALGAQRVCQGWGRSTVAGAGNRRFGTNAPFMPTRRRW